MRSHKFIRLLLPVSVLIFFLVYCTGKKDGNSFNDSVVQGQAAPEVSQNEKQSPAVQYYLFSENGNLTEADSIESAPASPFTPWTEAVRVAGLAVMYEPPLFLVNKAGVLPACTIDLYPAVLKNKIAETKTADGFYKTELGLLVRFYKNTVFSAVSADSDGFSLCRYNTVNNDFTPVISPADFKLEKEAQLVNLEFTNKWFASFKTEKNDRITFNYFSFNSFDDVLKDNYMQISQDEFIKSTVPIDLNSPQRENAGLTEIRNALTECEYKNIRAEFFSEALQSKIILIKQDSGFENTEEITACICAFKNSSDLKITKAILFATGKMLFFNSESRQWFPYELPPLPENTVYTYFAIYENNIIAAWEEQRFFEVGKAGLTVTVLPHF